MARIGLIILVVLACSACQSPAVATKAVALPSGKSVRVIAVGQVNFSNDSPALMLKYQTDLAVSDVAALRKETGEIWLAFKPEVESANLKNAIISANEVPKGWIIKTAKAYNFVYKKSGEGSWSLVDSSDASK